MLVADWCADGTAGRDANVPPYRTQLRAPLILSGALLLMAGERILTTPHAACS